MAGVDADDELWSCPRCGGDNRAIRNACAECGLPRELPESTVAPLSGALRLCPACGDEHRAWRLACPNCGVERKELEGACGVCLLSADDDGGALTGVLPCCRTRAHKACVAQYILAKAADAQLPVLCPRPDCRTRLPSAYIAASLSDAERERYNAAARFMKAKPEASADDAAEVDGLGLTRCPSCAHFVEKAEGCDLSWI